MRCSRVTSELPLVPSCLGTCAVHALNAARWPLAVPELHRAPRAAHRYHHGRHHHGRRERARKWPPGHDDHASSCVICVNQ